VAIMRGHTAGRVASSISGEIIAVDTALDLKKLRRVDVENLTLCRRVFSACCDYRRNRGDEFLAEISLFVVIPAAAAAAATVCNATRCRRRKAT